MKNYHFVLTKPFLSPYREMAYLANNIRYLFNNPFAWAEMGMQGRKHVEKFHDVMKEVMTLEKIYKRALQSERYQRSNIIRANN